MNINISEIPTYLITKSQINFRQLAGLQSFNPNHTPSSLPTVDDSSSSPSHVRCTCCDGELLRGSNSLICIYCGELNDNNNVVKDDLLFKNTNAYGWLLQSLNFNGSERVGSLAEGTGINGGQSPAEDELSLSELLDLKIVWRDVPKRSERYSHVKTSVLNSSSSLSKAEFDDFFVESKRATVSDVPEVQPVANKTDQDTASEGQDNLTLFQNVLPPETSVTSSIDAGDDASSGWDADFQSADNTKVENDTSGSFDPFVVAKTDLSAHMDSVFGQMEGIKDRKPKDDSDLFPSADKVWIEDDLFGQMEGLDNKKTNIDSDPFPSTGGDWAQDDLLANTTSATFQQAEPLDSVAQANDGFPVVQATFQNEGLDNKKTNVDSDPFPSTGEDWAQDDLFANTISATFQQAKPMDPVQANDGFSGHPNDHDSEGVDEEDWFKDGNWQKSSASNTSLSQQADQLDVFDKHNDGSLQDNLNDSSAQGVDVDWFENTNWQKSATNNTTINKDDNLFDMKPQNDAVSSSSLFNNLIQNDSSDPDNSKKQQSDATDWFQDSQWAIGASSSTTNVAANKDDDDDDAFDDWNDFTSSTGNERVAAGDRMSELNLFSSTADTHAQEVDFGNFSQSDLFSGSFSNKNPTDTQAGFDIFSQVSTASRNANVEAENSAEGPKNDEFSLNASTSPNNDVQMLLSQMHDLSFMLKSELSVPSKVPSKPDDTGSSHS